MCYIEALGDTRSRSNERHETLSSPLPFPVPPLAHMQAKARRAPDEAKPMPEIKSRKLLKTILFTILAVMLNRWSSSLTPSLRLLRLLRPLPSGDPEVEY